MRTSFHFYPFLYQNLSHEVYGKKEKTLIAVLISSGKIFGLDCHRYFREPVGTFQDREMCGGVAPPEGWSEGC